MARSTPSSLRATPTPARSRNQLPPKYPAKAVTVPTTKRVPLSTRAFAASTAPRRGVAASVARIIPVPYSLVTTSVPSAIAVIWANSRPQVTKDSGDSSALPLASHPALVAQTRVVRPAPRTNSISVDQNVERTDQNLIHSACSVSGNPGRRTPGTLLSGSRSTVREIEVVVIGRFLRA